MPTNPYFKNFYSQNRTKEQDVLQGIADEVISIFGINAYYIVRDSEDEVDFIFGEDVLSKFETAYEIPLLPKNINNYDGMPAYLSKFGLEQRSSANWLLSRTDFYKYIPAEKRMRPQEGDLIYSPIHQKLFEIKYADDDIDFHQLGIPDQRYYDIYTEVIKYSQNKINTGIDEIDEIQTSQAKYIIVLNLGTGSGTYNLNETVYQGTSYVTATTTATVVDWDRNNRMLSVQGINGVFAASSNVIGQSANASYNLISYNPRNTEVPYDTSDNTELDISANTIVDRTDTNILG